MGWDGGRDGLIWLEVRLSGRMDMQEEFDAPVNPPPPLPVRRHSSRRSPSDGYISISTCPSTWDSAESVEKWLCVGSLERLDQQYCRLTATGRRGRMYEGRIQRPEFMTFCQVYSYAS